MKRCIFFPLALLATLTVAAEPEATVSFQGYSGLINTPTATLFNEGKFYLQYGNQVETRDGYRNGDNYNFGVGLWEYVEVSGRLAEYKDPNGGSSPTDLSANIKLGIPFIPKNWFSVAVGMQDVGGAANYFDAQYAVASKNIFEAVHISLGLGKSDSNQGRLNGAFTSIAWQPTEWAKLSVEYDAADTQLAIHFSSPKNWLNSGLQLSTDILVSSTNEALKDDVYYGLGLTIPLTINMPNNSSQYRDKNIKSTSTQQYSTFEGLAPGVSAPSGEIERLRVQELLAKEGFESIKIGEADVNTVYLELENHIYNLNQIDALGVIFGIISKHIQYNYSHFTLVLKEQEIPILVVNGSLAEYDAFLRDDKPLKLDISTDAFGSQRNNITPDLQNINKHWLKPRFTFWPGIVSTVGTEFGVFDASVALISHLELPLWPGAAVTAQHTKQIAETKNFKEGEFFSDKKQKTGLQEYSLHQTFSLPYSIKNMTFVGRYRDTYNYFANEVRWQSFGGSHKVNLLTARYENQITPEREHYNGCNILFPTCWKKTVPQQRDVIVAKYRYYNADFNASAEVQVGQYWQQDKGVVVKLERMFGDVTLNLTYKDTKSDNEEANQFIGLGFSIPLTPRKDYNNKYFQIRGKPKWQYSVNTLIGKNHNTLTPGTGDSTQLFYNLDSAFYNNNRLSSEYIYENANRLKEAYYQAR
jgi:hypothetical protein